jgi:hypothetical protein
MKYKPMIMKKTLPITLICFFFLGIAEQSGAHNLSDLQISKIEKQVDSIFHSLVKAAENLDYDKISKGVIDKYQAGFIANGIYFSRYDSLANVFKSNSRNGAKQTITLQKEKISVLSESIVLLTASGDAYVELNAGQSFNVKFLWSLVFEKIDNDWKVIQSHQTNNR